MSTGYYTKRYTLANGEVVERTYTRTLKGGKVGRPRKTDISERSARIRLQSQLKALSNEQIEMIIDAIDSDDAPWWQESWAD
jgi:hypothetical protein